MNTYLLLFIAITDAIVAFVAGWLVSRHIGRGKVIDAEKLAEKILLDAKKEAENLKKEKTL